MSQAEAPKPAPSPALNPLVAPSKWQALKQCGWWLPFDTIAAALIIGALVTIGFWKLFGDPVALNFIAIILVDIFIAQLWLISLVFRCSCFVLETRADINLMPESAARIVAGYMAGGQQTRTQR